MLKAVLFDDEFIVLEGLQAMINWGEYGIELVGVAGDGPSALERFKQVRPDLVLTDICMPGMNGLELIQCILDIAPETYCIVFSGYNDYEYVKRAIQIGVSDYLEKPIEVEDIEKALEKAGQEIKKRAETQSIRRNYEESRSFLLEKATLELVLGRAQALPKWKENFGPQAEFLAGVTVLACSDELQLASRPDCQALSLQHGEEHLIALFHRIPPGQDLWEELDQEAERQHVAVGSGHTKLDPAQLADSYREALRALRCARFLYQRGRIGFDELGDLITASEMLIEREEEIVLSLRAGNYGGLKQALEQFIDSIKSELVAPETVERKMIKLLYMALETTRKNAAPDADLPFTPHVEIREIYERDQLLDWFRQQFERIIQSAMEVRETTKHATVEQAQDYMGRNLTRDLSLQEVARHVGMNPAYLSVLFKEVTGESYIKHITRYRMERAKKLLASGLKVSDVSEKVGYNTYRHFSEVFKKYTGVAPGEFKERFASALSRFHP